MMAIRTDDYLFNLLKELRNLPNETEWVEFKRDNVNPEEIGEYISALSNSAALIGKVSGFLVWGIDSETHEVVGTAFKPSATKKGGTELESWLLHRLSPKINFSFRELSVDGKNVVMLEIDAATQHPVQFHKTEYIRIGSYKKRLSEFHEKERELWRVFNRVSFEKGIAAEGVDADTVLRFLDYPAYFELSVRPCPDGRSGILEALENEQMICRLTGDKWNITNLGAVLFAKRLDDFPSLKRKAIRVVLYNGDNRIKTIREHSDNKGYASGFSGLCEYVAGLHPTNEVVKRFLRKQVPMFPDLAVRELIANAIIHQDFHITGTSPMIEIFSSRIEVTNPGAPLVQTNRFLDNPPRSRNEALASLMRRFGICEERGSGIDKVVYLTEAYQLPAPLFEATDEFTRAVLFTHRPLNKMDKADKVRACYLHACLRYVGRDLMTNTTIRERFGIATQNSATASRIISDTVKEGLIRPQDASASRKFMKYLPFWA